MLTLAFFQIWRRPALRLIILLKSLSSRIRSSPQIISRIAGIIVSGMGCLVITGWVFDIPNLKGLFPGQVPMEANTALGFICAGLSLWYLAREQAESERHYLGQTCAVIACLIGLLTFIGYLFGWNVGIEQFLSQETTDSVGGSSSTLVAPAVALTFLLSAISLLLLNTRRRYPLVQALSLIAGFIILISITGYAYGAKMLHGTASYRVTAHYELTLSILCAGLLFARPDAWLMAIITSNTAGGLLARRLSLAAIGLPLALGRLVLEGQRAGFYRAELGLSLFVLSITIVFGMIILRSARTLHQLDLERRRSEDALRHSEALFRAICDGSATGVFFFDTHGSILYANPADLRMTGLTWRGRMGLYWLRAIHPDDRERVISDWQTAIRGERPFGGVGRYLHDDGTIVWWDVKTAPVVVKGKLLGYVGIAEDITERKRLQEARTRLASIVESSDDAIISTALDGTILSWNAGAESICGYTTEEILGRPVTILGPPDRAGQVPQILERLESGERIAHYETAFMTKDSQRIDVSLTLSAIRDAAGKVIGASGIARDITQRKRLEEQLRQSQKMEAIGLLAGGVAHDFNNLLTAILGYSEIVLGRLQQEDPLRREIEQISRAASRAAALTNQLLAFGRKQMLQPEVLDLNDVVVDVGKLLRRLIRENVEIITNLETDLRYVEVDPGQIEHVLINLAVNSRDAMPRGGRLTIETVNVDQDEISGASPNGTPPPAGYIGLVVSDTGCGMDPQTKSRIFEPFYTTKEQGRGTGLGLCTVHGIVKQSGGHIHVSSQPGQGTTFKIYLPATEKPPEVTKRNAMPRVRSEKWDTIPWVQDQVI